MKKIKIDIMDNEFKFKIGDTVVVTDHCVHQGRVGKVVGYRNLCEYIVEIDCVEEIYGEDDIESYTTIEDWNNKHKGELEIKTPTLELKNNSFEFIRVSGELEQFSELKSFCGDDVTITYENCPGIGDYWCIKLDDCLKDKEVVVPNDDFILKISDRGFTVVDSTDVKCFFNIKED